MKAVCDLEASATDVPVKPLLQKHPGLGGALTDAFDIAESSHIICLPADNAIDLSCVPILNSKAKEAPNIIFSTSRWLEKGSFLGYNKVKLVLNRCANTWKDYATVNVWYGRNDSRTLFRDATVEYTA